MRRPASPDCGCNARFENYLEIRAIATGGNQAFQVYDSIGLAERESPMRLWGFEG